MSFTDKLDALMADKGINKSVLTKKLAFHIQPLLAFTLKVQIM